jgi:hypothetical protein
VEGAIRVWLAGASRLKNLLQLEGSEEGWLVIWKCFFGLWDLWALGRWSRLILQTAQHLKDEEEPLSMYRILSVLASIITFPIWGPIVLLISVITRWQDTVPEPDSSSAIKGGELEEVESPLDDDGDDGFVAIDDAMLKDIYGEIISDIEDSSQVSSWFNEQVVLGGRFFEYYEDDHPERVEQLFDSWKVES